MISCRTAAISAVFNLCDSIKGLAELWELCDTPDDEEFKPKAVAAFADDKEFGKLVWAKLDELFIDRSVGPEKKTLILLQYIETVDPSIRWHDLS